MGLDIRWPIGLMFTLLGVMLVAYGFATGSNAELYKRSLDINVNLYWGVLLLVFGLFMLVIIGLELFETIMRSYLAQGEQHYEVVLSVAIIAIARKVIILDPKDLQGMNMIGIAAIIFALTAGYYLMKKSHTHDSK